jgi:dipeptidase D
LGQALPGVDMVSFGPTILGAHSPDERLRVDTVPPFWEALLLLMKELAARRAA